MGIFFEKNNGVQESSFGPGVFCVWAKDQGPNLIMGPVQPEGVGYTGIRAWVIAGLFSRVFKGIGPAMARKARAHR